MICCAPPVRPMLPGQPVTFINEGSVVEKLEVEKIVVAKKRLLNKRCKKNQVPRGNASNIQAFLIRCKIHANYPALSVSQDFL